MMPGTRMETAWPTGDSHFGYRSAISCRKHAGNPAFFAYPIQTLVCVHGCNPVQATVLFHRLLQFPRPCGYRSDPRRACSCTPPQVERYLSKISGPLLDRARKGVALNS
jgi:hypothetical protein